MTDMTFAATDDDDCDRLLQKVGGGDREALGALFQREAGRLIAVARRIVRRREIAEEVVQESFVAAWRHGARGGPARARARGGRSTNVRNPPRPGLRAAGPSGGARRLGRRRDFGEEVVPPRSGAAWRPAARFDPARGRARAWLSTIVRNRALNVIRDGGRLDFADENTLAEYRNRADEAEAAFDMLGEGEALKRCLDSLEPLRRRSILLSYVVGYSHGEIASELTVPVGTVKAWIRRGVVALQECLS